METVIERNVVESRRTGSAHSRDLELVRYVGWHGLVAMRHVMVALGVGRTAAYRRVAACVERGLLERLELVRAEPGLLRATRDGLRYAGLGLPVAAVSPGAVDHWLRCASTAQLLGKHFGHERVLTERELVLAEQIETPDRQRQGRRTPQRGSAALSPRRPRRPRRRRHDRDRGRADPKVTATPATPDPGLALCRRFRVVAEVHYHCAPGQTRRAVERAVPRSAPRSSSRSGRRWRSEAESWLESSQSRSPASRSPCPRRRRRSGSAPTSSIRMWLPNCD